MKIPARITRTDYQKIRASPDNAQDGSAKAALLIFLALIAIIGCVFFYGPGFQPSQKNIEQNQKVASAPAVSAVREESYSDILDKKWKNLQSTQNKLKVKKTEIVSLVRNFEKEIRALILEIEAEKRRLNITALSDGLKYPRIKNDLLLIREKKAYIEFINQYLKKIEEAEEDLELIGESIKTDKVLSKVFADDETKALIAKIDIALTKHLPSLEDMPILSDKLPLKSFDEIWREITNLKTSKRG